MSEKTESEFAEAEKVKLGSVTFFVGRDGVLWFVSETQLDQLRDVFDEIGNAGAVMLIELEKREVH